MIGNERKTVIIQIIKATLIIVLAVTMLLADSLSVAAKSDEALSRKPDAPYGCKIAGISDDGIRFYWKKPDMVDGYEVYRAYRKKGGGKTSYKKITTINDDSQATYTDNKFNHNKKTVYYKVRAFRNTSKGRIYSDFSASKTARYRTSLTLNVNKVFIRKKARRRLYAYYGWGNEKNVIWTSSNPRVVAVTSKGTVIGKAGGKATVRCYSKITNETRSCEVVVDRKATTKLRSWSSRYTQKSEGYWVQKNKKATGSAVIMMAGDLMCTGEQQRLQGGATGNYNFNESYDGVKSIFAKADLTIGNLETVLSPAWPYMSEEAYIEDKPNCNAPSRVLDSIKYAGFDGVVMSNNHNCDAGVDGLLDTIDEVERYDLGHTGVFSSKDDIRYMIYEVNGIKVGYLSYTSCPFNGKEESWSKKERDTYINEYKTAKARADVKALRAAGAEYIIVYMHWGLKNAYSLKPSQKIPAQELADMGVDYIVGSHSHLLQEYTEITSSTGKKVPCFYSVGDFVSSINQIEGNRDSVILRIRLEKDEEGNVKLVENNYIACYICSNYHGKLYCPVPLRPSLNGNKKLRNYKSILERINKSVGDGIEELY